VSKSRPGSNRHSRGPCRKFPRREAASQRARAGHPRSGADSTSQARPRRHRTPDREATQDFFLTTLGLRLTDQRGDHMTFMRCSTDHHNIAITQAPRHFLHHTSWEVDDIDQIGHGAGDLLAVDPSRNLWAWAALLRFEHFWYFRDPSGHYAEYYSDMDEITEDEIWAIRTAGQRGGAKAWVRRYQKHFGAPWELDKITPGSAMVSLDRPGALRRPRCRAGSGSATAACLLADEGLSVLAIDSSLAPYPLPRAARFDGETMRTFQRIGCFRDRGEDLCRRGGQFVSADGVYSAGGSTVRRRTGGRTATISFSLSWRRFSTGELRATATSRCDVARRC